MTTTTTPEQKATFLDGARTLMGPLPPEYRAKIMAYCGATVPTVEAWNQIAGIGILGTMRGSTVQSVVKKFLGVGGYGVLSEPPRGFVVAMAIRCALARKPDCAGAPYLEAKAQGSEDEDLFR
jgi:hypothetical protein